MLYNINITTPGGLWLDRLVGKKHHQIIGHCKKLIKPRATTTTKQYSFAHRVINDWNSLPNEVVVAKSLNSFKSLLGKHWSNIDFRYHFTFY